MRIFFPFFLFSLTSLGQSTIFFKQSIPGLELQLRENLHRVVETKAELLPFLNDFFRLKYS